MKLLSYLLIIAFCMLPFLPNLFGQNSTQVIKGKVIDQQSEMPLIGASISILDIDVPLGGVSDLDGDFLIEDVPVGRRTVEVAFIGFETVVIPNVVVNAGKQTYLEIALEESLVQMDEVTVTAESDKGQANNELATVSARVFTVEEVTRYSGGRSDVARLVSNFAGVSTANDSRNDIVIRGNSPTGVLWRLQGIPIPNPNHFATLGTTGGPVSALNPNMLKNSDFLTSAFPAEYGDALAGVFDLQFRNGNQDKHEFMFQLGAVSGLEVMAEGPLNKKTSASYLVTGRYSFVGLASQVGLPIGTNATPAYQDVAFNINFGKSSIGNFSLFGIGGTSDIEFLHDEIDESDLFAASDEDAAADSRFGVIGLRHNLAISKTAYWRTIIAASTSQNVFTQKRYFNMESENEFLVPIADADNAVNRYSVSSFVNNKFNAKLTGRAGFLVERYDYDIKFRTRDITPETTLENIPEWFTAFSFEEGTTLVQGFAQLQYKLNPKWTVNAGLHGQLLTLNENGGLEPRLAVNHHLAANQTLTLGYGVHQQTQPLPILLLQEETAPGVFEPTNKDLENTRSNHFVLGYDVGIARDWRGKVEVYYQDINKVPVDPYPSSFSMLNLGADFGFPDDAFGLVNAGSGENFGVEFTLEKFYSQGYYGLMTASVYQSKYKGSDGVIRNTAFNNQYVVNVLFGKEFPIGKAKRNSFSIDTKLTTAGGRYYTPVDLVASKMAGSEVLDESRAFSEQYDPYFRWDFKMGVKLNSKKKKISHQFFMDFQNVTNRQNIFVKRYNRITNEVNDVYQVEFFPDFMYRVQF